MLGSVVLLPGCVTTAIVAGTTEVSNAAKSGGTAVDQSQIDQFKKGVATASDVQAKLGKPQQTAQTPDGGVELTYTSQSATGNTQSHVPIARWTKGSETTITMRNVTFAFDAAGKLADTKTTESSLTCQFGHCPD